VERFAQCREIIQEERRKNSIRVEIDRRRYKPAIEECALKAHSTERGRTQMRGRVFSRETIAKELGL
jgi:hypothetical protein